MVKPRMLWMWNALLFAFGGAVAVYSAVKGDAYTAALFTFVGLCGLACVLMVVSVDTRE